jgi:hypothetical protein
MPHHTEMFRGQSHNEFAHRATAAVNQKLQFPIKRYYSEGHEFGNGEDRICEKVAD